MRIGSLFSGIGGLELGLERAGLGHTVYQVEADPFCRAILAAHWPEAQRFDDVRTVGADLPAVDLLCGGFPCQDVSSAGKRAGLDGARSGLWHHFARIATETRPTWIVVENVASGAGRWLPFVRRDLWARGYESVPLGIAACEVGARHRRERILVVGRLADVDGQGELQPGGSLGQVRRRADHGASAHLDSLDGEPREALPRPQRGGRAVVDGGAAPHPDRESLRVEQGRSCGALGAGAAEPGGAATDPTGDRRAEGGEGPGHGEPGPDGAAHVAPWTGMDPRPWMVRGVHGLPGGLDGPWRAAGWTPARVREARIRALGNSVVPACAERVGRWILSCIAAERRAA